MASCFSSPVPFLAIYVAILSIGLLLAITRRTILLVRGNGLFILTALAAIGMCTSAMSFVVWLPLVVLAFVVRARWYLLRYDPRVATEELEDAFRMLIIPAVKTGTGYTLKLRDGNVFLDMRPMPCRLAILTFRQTRRLKKADLLRALLRKKFAPLFPRPRFHIR